MEKKKIGWIAAAFASASLAAIGIAAAHGNGGKGKEGREGRKAEMIQKYDKNKDGKLDESEIAAMRADMKAQFEAHKAEMLKKYDKNGDGKLDDTERAAMHEDKVKETFSKLDTNKDGVLSLDEFKAGRAEGEHEGFGGGFGGFHGRGHHGHRGPGGPGGDQDKDGK